MKWWQLWQTSRGVNEKVLSCRRRQNWTVLRRKEKKEHIYWVRKSNNFHEYINYIDFWVIAMAPKGSVSFYESFIRKNIINWLWIWLPGRSEIPPWNDQSSFKKLILENKLWKILNCSLIASHYQVVKDERGESSLMKFYCTTLNFIHNLLRWIKMNCLGKSLTIGWKIL